MGATTQTAERPVLDLAGYLRTQDDPAKRLHVAINAALKWQLTYAAGHWWLDGALALRVFDTPQESVLSLELVCACETQYALTPLPDGGGWTGIIPPCCVWHEWDSLGRAPDCDADTPADCRHVTVSWAPPAEHQLFLRSAGESLDGRATQPRWPATARPDQPGSVGTPPNSLEYTPVFTDDGRRFHVDRALLAAIERHVAPTSYWWTVVQRPSTGRRRARPNQGDPLLVALRGGAPVALLMPLLADDHKTVWFDIPASQAVPA